MLSNLWPQVHVYVFERIERVCFLKSRIQSEVNKLTCTVYNTIILFFTPSKKTRNNAGKICN